MADGLLIGDAAQKSTPPQKRLFLCYVPQSLILPLTVALMQTFLPSSLSTFHTCLWMETDASTIRI